MTPHAARHGIGNSSWVNSADLLDEIVIHYLNCHKLVLCPDTHKRVTSDDRIIWNPDTVQLLTKAALIFVHFDLW